MDIEIPEMTQEQKNLVLENVTKKPERLNKFTDYLYNDINKSSYKKYFKTDQIKLNKYINKYINKDEQIYT